MVSNILRQIFNFNQRFFASQYFFRCSDYRVRTSWAVFLKAIQIQGPKRNSVKTVEFCVNRLKKKKKCGLKSATLSVDHWLAPSTKQIQVGLHENSLV